MSKLLKEFMGKLKKQPKKKSSSLSELPGTRKVRDDGDGSKKQGDLHATSGIISITADDNIYTPQFEQLQVQGSAKEDCPENPVVPVVRVEEDRHSTTADRHSTTAGRIVASSDSNGDSHILTSVSTNNVNHLELAIHKQCDEDSPDTALCLFQPQTTDLLEYESIPLNKLEEIKNEAFKEANNEYPVKFYDFCIIACDADSENANRFKDEMCRLFNLTGCTIDDDNLTLGRDIFHAYEFMMDRSTKVFFYISDAFNDNLLYRRLQSGAVFQTLMSRIKREKCVPIFPQGLCDVPLPLSGIQGIDTKYPSILKNRVNSTYTQEVRQLRHNRQREFMELRQSYFNKLMSRKVQQCAAMNANSANSAIEEDMSPVSQNNAGNDDLAKLRNILSGYGVDKVQLEGVLSMVESTPAVSSPAVSVIGSKHVQIGNNIIVNVNGASPDTIEEGANESGDSFSVSSRSDSDSESEEGHS